MRRVLHDDRAWGLLINDDELFQPADSSSDSDDDDDYDGGFGGDGARRRGQQEVFWNLSDALKVDEKPLRLDDSLMGRMIYMRWDTPHGWLVGTITQRFTQETPRLAAKFNYRVRWFDGWDNHKLMLDNYQGGADAPYSSWVLLVKSGQSSDADIMSD
ncbi:hypothetical protein AB1Y20_010785 [Prymnesium parvum]|uniref:Uncharacterized protein n=1 Tax=Prymnesium parvum TaxID=97485 RepID=A0AB34IRR3_PRYPA